MVISFQRRKDDTLARLDKSSKKSWDEKIAGLCEKINSLENYYTTSSCSGRILLMISLEQKQKDLFLKIHHDLVSVGGLKKDLGEIARFSTSRFSPTPIYLRSRIPLADARLSVVKISKTSTTNSLTNLPQKSLIKFKQEPCILHVACSNLESAQRIHDVAKNAGWKHCGIIATGRRFVVELNCSGKIEFPIMKNGKVLVDDDFLKIALKQANENLKKSWEKIERLEKSI